MAFHPYKSWCFCLALAALAVAAACHHSGPSAGRPSPPAATPPPPPAAAATPSTDAVVLPAFQDAPVSTQEGNAFWYDVPTDSLAQRRAGPAQLTAASDTLPPNTFVRVTRTENGKSVIVRITDHGIHKTGGVIDLDRPAAEALEMIKAGKTHVKVEVLALKDGAKPAGK